MHLGNGQIYNQGIIYFWNTDPMHNSKFLIKNSLGPRWSWTDYIKLYITEIIYGTWKCLSAYFCDEKLRNFQSIKTCYRGPRKWLKVSRIKKNRNLKGDYRISWHFSFLKYLVINRIFKKKPDKASYHRFPQFHDLFFHNNFRDVPSA